MAPSSALPKPVLVLSGLTASALKLSEPLNDDRWRTGRVVCSMKTPALTLWAPATLVTAPEAFHSVLNAQYGNRRSYLNSPMAPGMPPPPNVALGRRSSGFAAGKNCGRPGTTAARVLASTAAWSSGDVYWWFQFTPIVPSREVVEPRLWSTVVT